MSFTAISGRRSSGGDISWPLQRAATLYPSSEAIIDGERSVTYAELAQRVDALGAALDHLAIPIGARVGVLGGNSLAHVECCLGVPAFGRVLVDLNVRLAEKELAFMVTDCDLELSSSMNTSSTSVDRSGRCARASVSLSSTPLAPAPATALPMKASSTRRAPCRRGSKSMRWPPSPTPEAPPGRRRA